MKILFPSLNKGKNFKTFLGLRLPKDSPNVFGINQNCSPKPLLNRILPNIQ